MKTCILTDSRHHGNTRKVVDAIAAADPEVTVMDCAHPEGLNFADYQCIGLASGIAYGRMYDSVMEMARKIPASKKTIVIYTCGSMKQDYAKEIKNILTERKAALLGCYHCKGWDTFGPFRFLGGINRKNPDSRDLAGAVGFYQKMCEKAGEQV